MLIFICKPLLLFLFKNFLINTKAHKYYNIYGLNLYITFEIAEYLLVHLLSGICFRDTYDQVCCRYAQLQDLLLQIELLLFNISRCWFYSLLYQCILYKISIRSSFWNCIGTNIYRIRMILYRITAVWLNRSVST